LPTQEACLQEEIRKSPHTAMVQGLSHTAIPTSFPNMEYEAKINNYYYRLEHELMQQEIPHAIPKTQGISLSQLLYERRSLNE
jgi:hypothetical protein